MAATVLERGDDLVDIPAHQPEIGVGRGGPEGVVVEGRHHARDARLLGQRLSQLRVELGLAEDGLDVGGLDLLDESGQVGGGRILTNVLEDDPD
jgi:hypothetical protein